MKKSQLITILLLIMTFVLMGAVFYIVSILNSASPEFSSIAPVKTKAQSVTYSRTIALNTTASPPTLTPTLTSTPTPTPTSTETATPTPTEIILAYASPSATVTFSSENEVSSSVSPTKTTILPETGYITNALVIFAAASLLIFFAFIF